jgi:hypothetical protein
MKTMLKISVLLNVILLGGLLFLWLHPKNSSVIPVPPVAAVAEAPPPVPVVQAVEAEPFHWSRLLSTNDFGSFVANLRRAGCPEATVEDIVRGDTGRAYSVMRQRQGLSPEEPGPWSALAQVQMEAYFLGHGPAPVLAAAPPLPLLVGPPPLVLQNIDLSTLNLDNAQTQAIAQIRETFWDSVGGANQNTNDPAYASRWQKAQNQADNMLQAMLGEQAFSQYQVQAYQLSLQNQQTSASN